MLAGPDHRTSLLPAEAKTHLNLRWIWTISLIAALGGLLFGYDFVVIGGAKTFYEKYFHLTTPFQVAWAMSSALAGCLVGAVVSGALSDRFGRKRLLILAGLLFALSSLGTALAGSFTTFVYSRLLAGVAIGLASNLSPLYIAEIAPAAMRGKLVSINQLTIVIGILAAQVINWLIAEPVPHGATPVEILGSWNGQMGWRWMFGVTAIPSVLFFLAMLVVPESPRWLASAGHEEQCRQILARVGGAAYAQRALDEIQKSLNGLARFGEGEPPCERISALARTEPRPPVPGTSRVRREGEPSDLRSLLDERVRPAVLIGVVLAVFQQWCGINVIFNYAEEVFSSAGYGVSEILFNIVITGLVNLIFTFVAIGTVDSLGRRSLMLIGSATLALVYLLIGACYATGTRGMHVLILVVAAIATYACTLAPVTWVVLSEIFPNRVRGRAMSLAVFALWAGCFTLTYTFPLLNRTLGPAGTFWVYAAICLIGFVFILRRLPETKRATLEEIESRIDARPTVI